MRASRRFSLAVWIVFFRAKQGQIAIQIALEFIVEEHADRPASGALDAGSFFLIEPVEIGVVFDFARLPQAVVDGLIVGQLIRLLEKAVPGFGERYDSQGLFLRDFHGLVGNERLLGKAANVFVHLVRDFLRRHTSRGP